MDTAYYKHPTAVIDEGATIGQGTKIWHFCHIMPQAVIGQGCNLGQNVFVANNVHLGNNVKIQNNVSVYEGVTCEDDVFIGPSAVFTNIKNPRSAIVRRGQYKTTHIGRGATIGANATVVCGNSLGAYCLVGAGAVVTHPVPAYALVLGTPARQVGWVSQAGHPLHFNSNQMATCPETKQTYKLTNGGVKPFNN